MSQRMGPQESGKAHPKPQAIGLPADLAAVSLIDAKTCAAPGSVSLSWWHEQVAAGEAPQPVIRAPRFTRWRLADVVAFWANLPQRASAASADKVMTQASKASAAASAKRAGKAASVEA